MKRDFHSLLETSFDVTVVGAGVYGACVANELAHAGYKVALIEASDFGAKTSANSLRILHGGLRYLQHFNLKRMRRSIASRRFFMQLAPQLIDSIAFRLPLYGRGLKSPFVMRTALWLNDLISTNRNEGLSSKVHLPDGYVMESSASEEDWFDGVQGLSGVGVWFEAVVNHIERMVLEVVKLASDNGAQVINYCKADQLVFKDEAFKGLAIRDRLKGHKGVLKTRWVIDSTGHDAGGLHKQLDLDAQADKPSVKQKWARAVNAVIKGDIIGDDAIALTVQDNLQDSKNKTKNKASQGERMLFFVPQNGNTMAGTFYTHQRDLKAGLKLSTAEKAKFIKTLNCCHPELNIREKDFLRWHSGWLPIEPSSEDENSLELQSQSEITQQVFGDEAGLMLVKGVKFTTAPAVAKDVLAKMMKALPIEQDTAIVKSDDEIFSERRPKHGPKDGPRHGLEQQLYARYGKHWRAVKSVLLEKPDYLLPIIKGLLKGEVHYACEHEMAQRLQDVMRRRFDFDRQHFDHAQLVKLATKISIVMQNSLAWTEKRRQAELENYIDSLSSGIYSDIN